MKKYAQMIHLHNKVMICRQLDFISANLKKKRKKKRRNEASPGIFLTVVLVKLKIVKVQNFSYSPHLFSRDSVLFPKRKIHLECKL